MIKTLNLEAVYSLKFHFFIVFVTKVLKKNQKNFHTKKNPPDSIAKRHKQQDTRQQWCFFCVYVFFIQFRFSSLIVFGGEFCDGNHICKRSHNGFSHFA